MENKRKVIKYPFPLDGVRLAYLLLPSDLSKHEVERLKIFIDSLGNTTTKQGGQDDRN